MIDFDALTRDLQNFFGDGLVILVGSGLSCAVGLPSMGELAAHLINEISGKFENGMNKQWERIQNELESGTDLESALNKWEVNAEIEDKIVEETSIFIFRREQDLFYSYFDSNIELPLSKLIKFISTTQFELDFITTNYDRLIEFSAEAVGLEVDSSFVGDFVGHLDPEKSRHSRVIIPL